MALAACSGSGSDREPGPPQQNALRQMQQKSVSEPVLYQHPQKAHALIDVFTRGGCWRVLLKGPVFVHCKPNRHPALDGQALAAI